ncbi:MAG TPA: hypothetical protein PLS90_13220 [Candidatus Sumerlaeota bacterium]|nr:hypothetical protein [Candidatus Sumerlaeota bacterium]HOR27955.1 hypothetical protein [Candidatus Sumerlaeota bacterium]HPK03405.1 hypothetical protein [Candidatus Sumerlaeota bacterium]
MSRWLAPSLWLIVGLICAVAWPPEPAAQIGQLDARRDNLRATRGGVGSRISRDSRFDRSDRQDRRPSSSRRTRRGEDPSRAGRRDRSRDRDRDGGREAQRDVQAAAGPAEGPARARGGQERSEVARPPRGGGRRAAAGGGTGAPLPQLQINPHLRDDALYFTPTRAYPRVGDRFISTINFFKNDKGPVEALDLWIKYDPHLLEPTWVDLSPAGAGAEAGLEARVWREEGRLRIAGQLPAPLVEQIEELARVHWRALGPAVQTLIEFEAPAGATTAVYSGGRNLVQPSNLGNLSRLSMAIRIGTEETPEPGLRLMREVRETLETASLPREENRVRLALVAPKTPLGEPELVATGEIGLLDVVLLNPDKELIDEVRFRLRYDPNAVKLLDADEDNYITQGINIFDGDFHEEFPFDFHGRNEVDPHLGAITYHVGSQTAPLAYPSGTIARIVYRMEREAGQALFWFEREEPETGRLLTDVSRAGISLLGAEPAVARAALHGTAVTVEPLVGAPAPMP